MRGRPTGTASRRHFIVSLWYRKFAGPGRIRDSIRPIAHRWRISAPRIESARFRMAVFQSAPPLVKSTSAKTMSTMPSSS